MEQQEKLFEGQAIIERLIQVSALFFNENEDTIILDSYPLSQRVVLQRGQCG
jgi:hypothetical protein